MKNSPTEAILADRAKIRSRLQQIEVEYAPLERTLLITNPLLRDRKHRVEQLVEHRTGDAQYHELYKRELSQYEETVTIASNQLEKLDSERETLQRELRENLVADKGLRITVEQQLRALKDLRTQLTELAGLAETNAAEITTKSASFDPANPDEVFDLARKYALERALPIKIAAIERAEMEQSAMVLQSAHDLISAQISPLVNATERSARERVRSDLRAHFSDETALERAVNGSAPVKEVQGFALTITNPGAPQLVAYVEQILQTAEGVIAAAERIS